MTNSKTFSLLAMTAIGMTIASSGASAQMWGPPRPYFGPPPIVYGPPPVFVPPYNPYAAALEFARQQAAAELARQQGIVCFQAPCGYYPNEEPGLVRETVRRTEEVERVYQSR